MDIDLVKQQETKSISDAKRQPDPITNGDVPLTNGVGKGYESNGIEALKSETPGSKIDSEINGIATNQQTKDDGFQRLPKPQQEILLLHGPGQRYRLEKAHDIPELKSDQEILVQVVAIGLNPVDWKGPDYNFGLPSFPWINGRDFAGIVVKGPQSSSRIKAGDVVLGPSTDYRDVRKAAYQEYVVTSHFNVARVPTNISVQTGAAIGVAFVSAVLSLGISLGVNFAETVKAPHGPDLLQILQRIGRQEIPEDVQTECFDGIKSSERPKPGDWIAIWGASSNTGLMAIQLAKLAGLRVICVADLVRHGARLNRLGADVLVDRQDSSRAVEVIRSVTGGQLRFAFDTVGKETAGHLQQTLTGQPEITQAHLVGLTGLPKSSVPGVKQHSVPIKVFHITPAVGEPIVAWLEQLLASNVLAPPDIDIAQGGLEGINDALDQLRGGNVSGKRIVVPLGNGEAQKSADDESGDKSGTKVGSLEYADKINADPDRIKFAYWVPNVSGGLVISKIEQRTKWDLDSNIKYARTAERVGFEYALSQIRFMAGYGADNQHESVSFSQALLHFTEKLIVIAALLPGPWNPAVAAKQIASIDNYTKGRIAVNIVSGWFKLEFTSIGQWWLDHAERYRRSREFITCLKGIWTQDQFSFKGDFYQFHDYPLRPKPVVKPGRPHPEIFQGGNSIDARENAATVSDYYFMNGNTLEGFQTQIADVKQRAEREGRIHQVKFALNGFIIARETEEEAVRVLQEIQGKANKEAVEAFGDAVKSAGASTSNKTGMWANSKFEDLVQYNDGFKTKLIGTPEQIADRILLLKSLGVSILLVAFLHYDDEIQQFGEQVLPLVRKLEAEGRGKIAEYEIGLTGDVYRERKKDAA